MQHLYIAQHIFRARVRAEIARGGADQNRSALAALCWGSAPRQSQDWDALNATVRKITRSMGSPSHSPPCRSPGHRLMFANWDSLRIELATLTSALENHLEDHMSSVAKRDTQLPSSRGGNFLRGSFCCAAIEDLLFSWIQAVCLPPKHWML